MSVTVVRVPVWPRTTHSSLIVHHSSLKKPTAMFKQFIDKIPGADVYMVASFLTFFVFFVLVGLYLWRVDKGQMGQMSRLPFDDSPTD